VHPSSLVTEGVIRMVYKGDEEGCAVPPRLAQPQHHNLGSNNTNYVGRAPVTPQKDMINRSMDSSMSDTSHFFSIPNIPVKYYRIVYRGVVALLCDPDVASDKSGAYVSYGEIIASTFEADRSDHENENRLGGGDDAPPPNDPNTSPLSTYSYGSKSLGDVTTTTSIAPSTISNTTALPLGPSLSFQSNYVPPPIHTQQETRPSALVIRVDEVLTGGYALDATTTGTSHTHKTPKRSNTKGEPSSNNSIESTSDDGSQISPTNATADYPLTTTTSSRKPQQAETQLPEIQISQQSQQHHGYLFQNYDGFAIAESIPSPPLLCQAGTFFYRVTSKSPLPILTGPCADAPVTRALALPGTMFEVSLRMGTVRYSNGGGDSRSGGGYEFEDGVVYLRLSHRRGWIADRRFVHLPSQSSNPTLYHHHQRHQQQQQQQHQHQHRREGLQYPTATNNRNMYNNNNASSYQNNKGGKGIKSNHPQMKVDIVMKEIIDFVDLSTCDIHDEMSLGGTSISSASINTPASVMRSRRWTRSRRRHTLTASVSVAVGGGTNSVCSSSRSGMILEHARKSKKMGLGSAASANTSAASMATSSSLTKLRNSGCKMMMNSATVGDGTGMGSSHHHGQEGLISPISELSEFSELSLGRTNCNTNSIIPLTGNECSSSSIAQLPSLATGDMEEGDGGGAHSNRDVDATVGENTEGSRSAWETSCIPSSNGTKKEPSLDPTIFLNRVKAPNGLKLLDASHFQVNNLIRGQTSNSSMPLIKDKCNKTEAFKPVSSILPSKNNPSSIFHTMTGTSQQYYPSMMNNSSGARSWDFDSSGRGRILARGVLFEASKRVERVGNFTPGSGLLKLADNTGWAIVPTNEELDLQYDTHQGSGGTTTSNTEGVEVVAISNAFEEVGHAIVTKRGRSNHQRQEEEPSMWVRITQRTGVLVSCSPVTNKNDGGEEVSRCGSLAATSHSSSSTGQSLSDHNHHHQSQDCDASSSVGSVFFDAFRSARKFDSSGGNNGRGKLPKTKQQASSGPVNHVIPCGMPVEVESWTSSQLQQEKQHFLRLRGGQGWIPRMSHGTEYSTSIDRPKTRQGSFWFRVHSKHGIIVRTGPSQRAMSIKSDDGVFFRFECGEFLRASEVLTINGHADIDETTTSSSSSLDQDSCNGQSSSECFAKLYRNKQSRRNHGNVVVKDESKGDVTTVSGLLTRGEWVHIYCNGKIHLEESPHPPAIQRHHEGRRYDVALDSGVEVRKGPSFNAETTGTVLRRGDNVLINEQVTGSGEKLTWLRLKDGRGWVHNTGDKGEMIMTMHSSKKHSTDVPYNSLIARLFNTEVSTK